MPNIMLSLIRLVFRVFLADKIAGTTSCGSHLPVLTHHPSNLILLIFTYTYAHLLLNDVTMVVLVRANFTRLQKAKDEQREHELKPSPCWCR